MASERAEPPSNLLAHAVEHALELAGLELALENLQRAEQGQTGVLERRELAGEGGELLLAHAAEAKAAAGLLGLGGDGRLRRRSGRPALLGLLFPHAGGVEPLRT
jgi:hypothetical protein